MGAAGYAGPDFQIVGDDPLIGLARRLRICPEAGLGVLRRAAVLALFAWLPMMIWAALAGELVPSAGREPVYGLYPIHAQCLLAIPLFVLGEVFAQKTGQLFEESVRRNALIGANQIEAFDKVVSQHVRLRRWVVPWAIIAGLVLVSMAGGLGAEHAPGLVHRREPGTALTFGAVWYICVARAIFQALLLGWLWKIALWAMLLFRLARLKLSLVPQHPDRLMGLGLLGRAPIGFSPFVLAVSAVSAATAAHEIVYHGAALSKYYVMFAVLGAVVALLVLGPLFAFVVPLMRAKRRALVDYGALLADHHRLVDERWIKGQELGERSVLEAPELGPAVDIASIYQAVTATRVLPIGRLSLLAVLVPVVVPMLVVASLKIPIAQMLLKIGSALL